MIDEESWDINKETNKGLKTLQREFTELVTAFIRLAEQVNGITGSLSILAIEMAKIKKQIGVEDGPTDNEEVTTGSGEEEKQS